MIKEVYFTKEFIQGFRKKYKKANSEYVEKTIYAFELLSLLTEHGFDFVFKGGTSLLLVLPEPTRLSIDIDIVGKIDISKLMSLSENSRFINIEEDKRENQNELIKHYKFYYSSVFNSEAQNILLDIVLKKHNFPSIQSKIIETPFFETNRKYNVIIPSLESLLADKLAAFAPNTIGIPFDDKSNSRKVGIIKQLFDISNLFDIAKDIQLIKASYESSYNFECELNKENYPIEACLKDSIETSYLISQSGFRGSLKNKQLDILRFGCRNIINYLLSRTFSIDQAKLPTAKIAFLASIILKNKEIDLSKIREESSNLDEIKKTTIVGKYKILNKLKPISPEAFYYWHLVSQIEEGKLW